MNDRWIGKTIPIRCELAAFLLYFGIGNNRFRGWHFMWLRKNAWCFFIVDFYGSIGTTMTSTLLLFRSLGFFLGSLLALNLFIVWCHRFGPVLFNTCMVDDADTSGEWIENRGVMFHDAFTSFSFVRWPYSHSWWMCVLCFLWKSFWNVCFGFKWNILSRRLGTKWELFGFLWLIILSHNGRKRALKKIVDWWYM